MALNEVLAQNLLRAIEENQEALSIAQNLQRAI
jgi:hypothetical protein